MDWCWELQEAIVELEETVDPDYESEDGPSD